MRLILNAPVRKGVLNFFLPMCECTCLVWVHVLFSENFLSIVTGLILDTIILSHESLK